MAIQLMLFFLQDHDGNGITIGIERYIFLIIGLLSEHYSCFSRFAFFPDGLNSISKTIAQEIR